MVHSSAPYHLFAHAQVISMSHMSHMSHVAHVMTCSMKWSSLSPTTCTATLLRATEQDASDACPRELWVRTQVLKHVTCGLVCQAVSAGYSRMVLQVVWADGACLLWVCVDGGSPDSCPGHAQSYCGQGT